jgi:hypothetical protein
MNAFRICIWGAVRWGSMLRQKSSLCCEMRHRLIAPSRVIIPARGNTYWPRPVNLRFTPASQWGVLFSIASNLCGFPVRYSITWSARASSVAGTSMPSVLAVLRLITSSYLVGCSTGISAGLAPLRILSTYTAARRYISCKSVA